MAQHYLLSELDAWNHTQAEKTFQQLVWDLEAAMEAAKQDSPEYQLALRMLKTAQRGLDQEQRLIAAQTTTPYHLEVYSGNAPMLHQGYDMTKVQPRCTVVNLNTGKVKMVSHEGQPLETELKQFQNP